MAAEAVAAGVAGQMGVSLSGQHASRLLAPTMTSDIAMSGVFLHFADAPTNELAVPSTRFDVGWGARQLHLASCMCWWWAGGGGQSDYYDCRIINTAD